MKTTKTATSLAWNHSLPTWKSNLKHTILSTFHQLSIKLNEWQFPNNYDILIILFKKPFNLKFSLLPQVLKGLVYTDDDIMNIMPSTQNVTNNNEISSSTNADLDEWNELGDGSEDENDFNLEKNDNSAGADSC